MTKFANGCIFYCEKWMVNIIGISAFIMIVAALLIDGDIISAVQEERLGK